MKKDPVGSSPEVRWYMSILFYLCIYFYSFLSLLFFCFFFGFCPFFLGLHPQHMEISRLGVELELQPMLQLQQCGIWAVPATCTTAHGNTGSLIHWARAGIQPASSWILVRFINRWATTGTSIQVNFSSKGSCMTFLKSCCSRYTKCRAFAWGIWGRSRKKLCPQKQ